MVERLRCVNEARKKKAAAAAGNRSKEKCVGQICSGSEMGHPGSCGEDRAKGS